MPAQIDRRTLLKGSLLAGAVGLGAPSLLAGCSSDTPTSAGAAGGNAAAPVFKALSMPVKADLPATDYGVPEAFFNYPAKPPVTVTEVPGDGKPLSVMTQTYAPVPPGKGSNTFWQELDKRLGSALDSQIIPVADYGTKF